MSYEVNCRSIVLVMLLLIISVLLMGNHDFGRVGTSDSNSDATLKQQQEEEDHHRHHDQKKAASLRSKHPTSIIEISPQSSRPPSPQAFGNNAMDPKAFKSSGDTRAVNGEATEPPNRPPQTEATNTSSSSSSIIPTFLPIPEVTNATDVLTPNFPQETKRESTLTLIDDDDTVGFSNGVHRQQRLWRHRPAKMYPKAVLECLLGGGGMDANKNNVINEDASSDNTEGESANVPATQHNDAQKNKEKKQGQKKNYWYFQGTSHVRGIFETLALSLDRKKLNKLSGYKTKRFVSSSSFPSGTKFAYEQDRYLQQDLAAASIVPPTYQQYNVIVVDRFMWDLSAKNTFPQAFYVSLRDQLVNLRLKYVEEVAKRRASGDTKGAKEVQELVHIFFRMPHSVRLAFRHVPDSGPQCRNMPRVKMYRRLGRCAAHFANTRANISDVAMPNTTLPSASMSPITPPKIELLDVFEYTEAVPRSMIDNQGHHYGYAAEQAILAQLLDRHICPGSNIAGPLGLNNSDALDFDKDPWQGVEEDCREIFEVMDGTAAASLLPTPAPRVKTGLDDPAVQFTPNGFNVRTIPKLTGRPLDNLFINKYKIFDPQALSCGCMKNDFPDECRMQLSVIQPEDVAPMARYYCRAKLEWDAELVQEYLPTHMNFTGMSSGHWREMLTQLATLLPAAPGTAAKQSSQHPYRFRLCLFNLGARMADISDVEYFDWLNILLRREESKIATGAEEHQQLMFMCQCSGVTAPHLHQYLQEHGSVAEDQRARFCNGTRSRHGGGSLEKLLGKAKSCRQVLRGIKES